MMIQAMEASRIEAASPIGDMDQSNRHRAVYQLTLLADTIADTLALLSEESEVCQPAAKLAEAIAGQLEGQLQSVLLLSTMGRASSASPIASESYCGALHTRGAPMGKCQK